MKKEEPCCVYFFPVYAAGHLISMVELAKRLLLHQCEGRSSSFSVTILLAQPNDPAMLSPICSSYLQSVCRAVPEDVVLPIQFHELPPVEIPSPTHFDGPIDFTTALVRSYLPHIKASLLASNSPISGLVVDFFAADVADVAKELNVPIYTYYPSTATSLSLLFHLSGTKQRDEDDQVEYSLEANEEIHVPGLSPIPSSSLSDPLLDIKSASCKSLMYHSRRCMEANGVIVNSNIHIEEKAVPALASGAVTRLPPGSTFPQIYPVGPVVSLDQDRSVQEHKCLEWLHKQPPKSVVYLCFGSIGAFTATQIQQIAIGLERSGHRFLWVLRMPGNDFLRGPTDANLEEVLPEGFLERTRRNGLVWPSWAPQMGILSHEAIGGFVTHCGWNSILESLWFGVPVIPWPLYSEQHLNAFQLEDEIHTACGPLAYDRKNDGFVTAAELERAIKQLMDAMSEEGRKARGRAAELKEACRKAVQREGVSYVHMEKLAVELLGRHEV